MTAVSAGTPTGPGVPSWVPPEPFNSRLAALAYLVDAPTGVAATDTAAIQTQLTAAGLAGGGIVQLRAGSYIISTALAVPSNVYLLGVPGAKLIVNADITGALINADQTSGNTNILIYNVEIDGVKASRTAGTVKCRCIYMVKVTDLWIENCYVHDAEDHGIHLNDCDRVHIDNVTARNCGKNDTSVGGSGIAWTIAGTDKSGTISNCISEGHLRAGYRFASVGAGVSCRAAVQFSNCHAENCGTDTATPEGSAGFSLQGDGNALPVIGVSYVGCSTIRCGDGIRFAGGVRGCSVSGGTHQFNDGSGVSLSQGVTRNSFDGVTCANNSQSAAGTFDGFRMEDSASGCMYNTFTGCVAYDDQGTKTQGYGLREMNLADLNVITGCEFSGNLTAPWLIVGPKTRLRGNGHDAALASLTLAASVSTRGYQDGEFIRCLGTTTVTSIEASHPGGKRVTFYNSTGSTVTILGVSVPTVTAKTFISDHVGTAWVPV